MRYDPGTSNRQWQSEFSNDIENSKFCVEDQSISWENFHKNNHPDPSLAHEIDNSAQRSEGLSEWWDNAHQKNHWYWLSGSPENEVWKRLDIEQLLLPGCHVLDIGVGLALSPKALAKRDATYRCLIYRPRR